jgi:hypothetical protein
MERSMWIATPRANDFRARVLPVARIGFAVTVIVSLGLGLWGLEWYSQDPLYNVGREPLDLLYYDLQLFVLSSAPTDAGGPFPWPLEIARFLAPAAAVYALFEAARALFAGEWRRVRERRMSEHAIVIGDTPVADAIADGVRDGGRAVLRIPVGDVGSLRDAGIARARFVYACADDHADSSVNVLTAAIAIQDKRAPGAATLAVYAHISSPTYALALRARHLSQLVTSADFFNIDELAARELVRRDAATFEGAHPLVVIAGLGAFGQSIVVELARMWRLSSRAQERLTVILVDPAADTLAAELLRRWPAVAEACTLQPVAGDLATAFREPIVPTPHRVYLCYEAEDVTVQAALTLAQLWQGGARSLILRLDRLSRLAEVFGDSATSLLDDIEGRLYPVRLGQLVVDPKAIGEAPIHEDIYERLAQLAHDNYLRAELNKGRKMGSAPAMVAWEPLDEEYKQANRAQVRDIGSKLAMIGCTVAPRTGPGLNLVDDDAQVEMLATAEHDRWMADRKSQGWTYGAVRDNVAKHHPSLVAWSELSNNEKDKDRDVVRNMSAVLSDFGLQIIRLQQPASQPAVPQMRNG